MTGSQNPRNRKDSIPVSRKITLDEIKAVFGEDALKEVVGLSKAGKISAKAYTIELSPEAQDLKRLNRSKENLAVDDWIDCSLSQRGHDGLFYLANSSTDRAHCEITFNRSEINRLLNVTGQSGGQRPKMGGRFYGYLAALWGTGVLEANHDARDLFTELEETPNIWDERGPIQERLAFPEIKEFLRVAEFVSQQLDRNIPFSDISITSAEDK
ncbi:hypothetical protein [uncultured Roseovarius sp.]|uniref:hypothetical protein n=1 Tax=uncultured Roseovarius sp. TaxID=293344 RepID=UPI0025929AB2|nr:hypothetical protein [uncultured Roseovarius sp.]